MENIETKKVAVLYSLTSKWGRAIFAGIVDYAQKHGGWFFLFDERRSGERVPDLARTGVSGVIVSHTSEADALEVAALRVPVVFLDPSPGMFAPGYPISGAPSVMQDNRAIGAAAAQYFTGRGYASFAYVDDPASSYWGAGRRSGFADALAVAGFDCPAFDGFTDAERRDWPTERTRLAAFLRDLPRTTAVFAPTDDRARLVLEACLFAGLRVPDDIAVLGVDNNVLTCESTVPALSSIHTDGFRRGQIAAEMLDALMDGREPRERAVAMPPVRVVTRGSTGYGAMRDPVLSKAIDHIRRHAKSGEADVAAVARAAGCSRRTLEQRFRSRLGFSVRDEIVRERIECVKALLATGDLSIGEITERTNFARESHLAKLFKRVTGITMTEWRRENRDTR